MAAVPCFDSEPDILAAWGQSFQILTKEGDPNDIFGTAEVRQLSTSPSAC